LRCDLSPTIGGVSEYFACDRTSHPDTQCLDGDMGSLIVFMDAVSFEVDKPAHCVLTTTSLGYKQIGGGRSYRFDRSP
jgi:hypothetical protein